MSTTLLFAHPSRTSFNAAVLDTVERKLAEYNREYTLLDLYADGFQPALDAGEWRGFARGESVDPQVRRYQDALRRSTRLILIFPVWWGSCPAMLKGFFDRVCTAGFAFAYGGTGLVGQLTHIARATLFTTSNAPTFALKYLMGNIIQHQIIKATLKGVGVGRCDWHHLGNAAKASDARRKAFLAEVERTV